MCKCVGDAWLYDIQTIDIERFQYYLRYLLVAYGLSQAKASLMLNVSPTVMGKFVNGTEPMPVPMYAYLRMWMQRWPNAGALQNDALYYFLHRMDEHDIVKWKRDRMIKFFSKHMRNKHVTREALREIMDRCWAAEFGNG